MHRQRYWREIWEDGAAGERLVLRGLRPSDYENWRRGYAERREAANIFDDGPLPDDKLTLERFLHYQRRHSLRARQDRVYVFSAFAKASGELVGFFDLSTLDRENACWANVGYVIHNQHQRQGFGRDGLSTILRIGASALGYHRIEASIDPANLASLALANSVGMQFECIRKKFWRAGGAPSSDFKDQEIYVALA